MDNKPTFSSVISNPGFRFLWFNQILIQLAYNTLNFALLIWVYKLTDSNIAVAFLMVAVYLPSLIFGLLAGIYVDVADRKKIILGINLLLALSFLMFIFIKGHYFLILLNTFFINTLGQFFMPTESSSIPMLVKKRQLIIANSLFSLTLYGSFMIGFASAGPILSHSGINAVFIFGVLASLSAWALSLNLPSIKVERGGKAVNLPSFHEIKKMYGLVIKEGKTAMSFIKGKVNLLVAILLLAMVQGVIGTLAVVVSSYMETVLHIHATDASYVVMIPLGLGMVIGAFLIGKYAHKSSKRALVVPALILAGTIFLLVGIMPIIIEIFNLNGSGSMRHLRFFFRSPSISILVAIESFLLGIATVGIIIPSQTVIQENTTEKNRGKIFAVLLVVMNVFAAVVSVIAGILADILGVEAIFIIMGILVLPMAIVVRNPAKYLTENFLPIRVKEFLGLGHWDDH